MGALKIENSNFNIDVDKVKSQYVKKIDGNNISLNTITGGRNIEIEIPVKFPEGNIIDVEELSRETTITLTGAYKDNSENETEIEGKIRTRLIWTDEANVTVSQDIEKFIKLNDTETLLQQKIEVQVDDNKLPIESDVIEIQVPEIDGEIANKAVVLVDNEYTEYNYNYDGLTGILQITNKSTLSSQNKIDWKNTKNTYKIIYTYEGIEAEAQEIALQAKVATKLYTKDEVVKELSETKQVEEKGNIISISTEPTKEIYKGYLYANVAEETTYKENVKLEISEANSVKATKIESGTNNFVDENGNLVDANNNTYYKQVTIKKHNMQEMLGENGTITIKNVNDEQIAEINKDSKENDDGDIVITLADNGVNAIVIETTKPQKEGILEVELTKGIKSEGYDKAKLKEFITLEEEMKVVADIESTEQNNANIEEISKAQITMKDTKTEAKLSLNTRTLSTLSKEENLIINANLLSNNETQDLYKNPTLNIYLPEEIEDVQINSVKALYVNEEEMTISNYEVKQEDGRNVIYVALNGEQKEYVDKTNLGIQVLVNASITINKDTPTKSSAIEMKYTNENGNEEQYVVEEPINFESKYGMFVYNKVENLKEEDIDNINTNEIKTELKTGEEEKQVTVNTTLVNNYEQPVNNVAIIGNLNKDDSNIDVALLDKIEVEDATVYYATENTEELDSENWEEDIENIEDAKAYKIELQDIQNAEDTKLSYNITIPANLDYNQKSLSTIKTVYDYAEQEQIANTNINLYTAEIEAQEPTEINPGQDVIDTDKQEVEEFGNIYVKSSYGDKELAEGDTLYQGQSIKNTVVIENTTDEEITNLNITATQTNANFFIKHVSEEKSSIGTMVEEIRTSEDLKATEIKLDTIESLKPGEKATLEYQYIIKETAEGETEGTLTITAEGKEEKEVKTNKHAIEKGNLKLTMECSYNEAVQLYAGGIYELKLIAKNISAVNQKDNILELHIPNTTTFNEKDFNVTGCEIVENKDGIVKIKVEEIPAGETKSINILLFINKLDPEVAEINSRIFTQSTLNNKTYTSNEIDKIVYNTEAKLEIVQTGSSAETALKNGEELVYTTKIKNISINDKEFDITDSVPKAAVIQEAYIMDGNEKTPIEDIDENNIKITKEIKAKSEITLVIKTKIDTSKATSYSIKNTVCVLGVGQVLSSNVVEYDLVLSNEKPKLEDVNSVTGTVWIDKNKDGKRDSEEEAIPDCDVKLINTKTGEVATTEDGTKLETTTDSDGSYYFENMTDGEYIVVFKYDTSKYTPTQYKAEGLSASQDSDVIQGELNGETIAKTDSLTFNKTAYDSIDAGFTENYKFDLKLDKYVSRVVVQNSLGTGAKEYNKEQLAKIEIPAQYLTNSTVLVEYDIEITNQGEIEGYAGEIIDYLPKDMTFSSEINKQWYMSTDGNVHTSALTNEIIKPGETKKVSLILTKTMTQNNIGTSTNIAEIGKASNSLSIKDIDSTPGNFAEGEDDISKVEVLISLSTGANVAIYTTTALAVLAVIGLIIFKIKTRKEE